jgi:hypothetical protein
VAGPTFSLRFTTKAKGDLKALEADPAQAQHVNAVRKALGLMETNLRHPSLNTHKYDSLVGARGEDVFEAYAENATSGAWRIFWHYGPDETEGTGKKARRIPVITVVAITPHP